MKKNLWVLFCMLGVSLSGALPASANGPNVGITVSIAVATGRLVIGENPLCTLIIRNGGNRSRDVVHPDYDGGGISFRITNLSTGETSTIEEKVSRGASHRYVTLPAGKEIKTYFSLFDRIHVNKPGQYAVSVLYRADKGGEPFESNVIRITLSHLSVSNVYLPAVTTPKFDTVFLDPSVDPPEIMRARFSVSIGGGLQGIQRIAKAKLGVRPYVSLPPNKDRARHRWFAWMEEGVFKAVFLHGLTGKQTEARLRLKTGRSEIIPPLSIIDAGRCPASRGAALVWSEGNGGDGGTIRRIDLTLTGDGARADSFRCYRLPGERPQWMMGHLPSNGDRLMTCIRSTRSGLGLYLLPWPDKEVGSVVLKSLLDWPKDVFVAAGATLNGGDEICGATLVWNKGQKKDVLELIAWKVDAMGNGEELYRDVLPWSPMLPIGATSVRVRPDGTPAVLMRSDDYQWSVWDSRKKAMKPVPAPFSRTKRFIDIAFLDQEEIVIICADEESGFAIKRLDGTDLSRKII